MVRIRSSLFLAALFGLLHMASAQAQSPRTFVSAANGNDDNDCSRPTPCRTLGAAHNKTSADGEITVLDPGGYGGLTITKAISIINDGVGEASMLVSGGGNAITINAGAGDAVNIRGLTIQGIGFGGGNGIVFNSGRSLTVQNCVIRNLGTGSGILFIPTSPFSNLAVSNTLLADSSHGVRVTGQLSPVSVALSRVEVHNNSLAGLWVTGRRSQSGATSTNAIVVDSVFAGGSYGVMAEGANVVVMRSAISQNGSGVATRNSGIVRIGQSAVTGNQTGWELEFFGGPIQSYGDNYIDGNERNDSAPPAIAKK